MTNTNTLLTDKHGRKMRKLRVSLLDACNFRCFYCMPEDATFKQKEKLLSPIEIERICKILVSQGIEQIRLTGGEPLLRSEFKDIATRISKLGLKRLGLTTNGFYLKPHLEFLKSVGCDSINVSLDSLDKDKFNRITRSHGFKKVYDGIIQAREMNFDIKLNVVLIRGQNDEEMNDFIEFSAKTGIEVRFLEMMKIGQVADNDSYFISADEMISKMKAKYEISPITVEKDSTSFKYSLSNGAIIGFIASETKPFCATCSRLRLTCDGALRACLMSEKGMDLKGIEGQELEDRIVKTIGMKPYERISHVNQDMFEIGG